ncbi:MAG: WD40 repeat domain-containing protein [Hyphomicrobiaceae bacterium]
MRLIDIESRRTVTRVPDLGPVWSLAFVPDGRSAFYGHRDNSLRIVDLQSGRELQRLQGHSSQPEVVVCSPDGRYAVSGRTDADEVADAVLVWDLQSGVKLRHPERHMSLVTALAISADSRRALTGTGDGYVFLWEVETGREIRRYQGHAGNVNAVAFSPDNRFVVSGSGTDFFDADLIKELGVDNTVRIWDAASTHEVARCTGHASGVTSVAVSPNGRYVLSGSKDKTVRLWHVPEALAR